MYVGESISKIVEFQVSIDDVNQSNQAGTHCIETIRTLTSCVSENRSLTKVSKASIDFSVRFPPMDHT